MGIDTDFGRAFAKSQLAAGQNLPMEGAVFVSVKDADKDEVHPLARQLQDMGFDLLATEGTSGSLSDAGISSRVVKKIGEGRPNVTDYIKNGSIQLVINTPSGKESAGGARIIRRTVLRYGLPYATTLAGACAMASGIEAMKKKKLSVRALQDFHRAFTQCAPKTLGEKPKETSVTMKDKGAEVSHGVFSRT
jgi:carbamoyl-phosphate synthase large subunit